MLNLQEMIKLQVSMMMFNWGYKTIANQVLSNEVKVNAAVQHVYEHFHVMGRRAKELNLLAQETQTLGF